jgi:lipoate-protein ligase A
MRESFVNMSLIKLKSSGDPQQDMDEDYQTLLHLDSKSSPSIRFYDWKPCITYGLLSKPEELIHKNSILPFFKRPTGGGVIFHVYDIAFGLIISASHPCFSLNTLKNYHFVNTCVIDAIQQMVGRDSLRLAESSDCEQNQIRNYCLAHATKYDVVWKGLKVGGAAQRRLNTGLLHQGTVALYLPSREMIEQALPESLKHVAQLMVTKSASLMPSAPTDKDKDRFRKYLYESLNSIVG